MTEIWVQLLMISNNGHTAYTTFLGSDNKRYKERVTKYSKADQRLVTVICDAHYDSIIDQMHGDN